MQYSCCRSTRTICGCVYVCKAPGNNFELIWRYVSLLLLSYLKKIPYHTRTNKHVRMHARTHARKRAHMIIIVTFI